MVKSFARSSNWRLEKGLAEILAGDIGELMGFIENQYVGLEDQLAKATLLHHHIREEQMMVDHYHVGIHRRFTRFDHETVFI